MTEEVIKKKQLNMRQINMPESKTRKMSCRQKNMGGDRRNHGKTKRDVQLGC
jgi:hypothetical protein